MIIIHELQWKHDYEISGLKWELNCFQFIPFSGMSDEKKTIKQIWIDLWKKLNHWLPNESLEKDWNVNIGLKMIWINHSINTNKNIIIEQNLSMIMIDRKLSIDLLMMSWIIQFKIILMELRWLWLFCSYHRFYSSSLIFIIRMT